MEVTVAIINYNYGRFLKHSLESALNQVTNIEYEVLVIDDGSTDCTDDILAMYANNKKLRVSKTSNQGFAKSLSRAVSEAKGKYLFLMDADDFFRENKISNLLPYLEDGYLYVTDTSTYIDESGKVIGEGNYGSTSCDAINVMAAKFLLPVENELSFFSFYKLGRGKILKQSFTYYRVHNNSMTNRNKPGIWQDYLAKITLNLAETLFTLYKNNDLSVLGIKNKNVKKVANFFRSQANYNFLEGSLERKQYFKAYMYYFNFFYFALISKELNYLTFKMLFRTILAYPSKNKINN